MPPRPYAEPVSDPLGVGQGFQEHVFGESPPAGQDFVYQLSGQYLTRFRVVTFNVETSAAAGARSIFVNFEDPDDNYFAFTAPVDNQGPGVGFDYTYYLGGLPAGSAALTVIAGALADMWLPAGWHLRIQNPLGQPGDQISEVKLTMDRVYSDVRRPGRPPRRRGERRAPLP